MKHQNPKAHVASNYVLITRSRHQSSMATDSINPIVRRSFEAKVRFVEAAPRSRMSGYSHKIASRMNLFIGIVAIALLPRSTGMSLYRRYISFFHEDRKIFHGGKFRDYKSTKRRAYR